MSDEAHFEIRHGTQDLEVFNDVIVANQYQLSNKFPADSLIIDIGANVGCFAVACLLRGAGVVICFEPGAENFAQLGKNLLSWPDKYAAMNVAVWRSDVEEPVCFSSGNGSAACCCFPANMVEHNDARVNTIGLDEIIKQATNDGERRIQLLKIDAEYSEYPILYTSKRLDLVDEIVGETHEFNGDCVLREEYYNHPIYKNTAADMQRFLKDQGFEVHAERESFSNQINTLFFARRQTPETTSDPS